MPLVRVDPDDWDAVSALAEIANACAAVDDPQGRPALAAEEQAFARWGADLHPAERYLYVPDGETEAVGTLTVNLPVHDNLQLADIGIGVRPERRRQGHGSAMMTYALDRVRAAGRSIVWIGGVEDDPASCAFAEHHGFRWASHDARRHQVLADVDTAAVDALYAEAEQRARDYRLERLLPPFSDELLTELAEVTAAINDAPMGDLDFEPELFDVARMREIEAAQQAHGWRVYRMAARQLSTGQLGGHTFVVVSPLHPEHGWQWDTAVSREHRGHRLGLLLKIATMRWLADAEPQLRTVETYNQADNRFMISVNEAIGYRLSQTFATYQRQLEPGPPVG